MSTLIHHLGDLLTIRGTFFRCNSWSLKCHTGCYIDNLHWECTAECGASLMSNPCLPARNHSHYKVNTGVTYHRSTKEHHNLHNPKGLQATKAQKMMRIVQPECGVLIRARGQNLTRLILRLWPVYCKVPPRTESNKVPRMPSNRPMKTRPIPSLVPSVPTTLET